jgi:hypothetical protein
VQRNAVANRHLIFEDRGVCAVSYMDDGVVLNICAIANADVVNVAPDDSVEPDRRLVANMYVAYDLCAIFDESRGMNLRMNPAK